MHNNISWTSEHRKCFFRDAIQIAFLAVRSRLPPITTHQEMRVSPAAAQTSLGYFQTLAMLDFQHPPWRISPVQDHYRERDMFKSLICILAEGIPGADFFLPHAMTMQQRSWRCMRKNLLKRFLCFLICSEAFDGESGRTVADGHTQLDHVSDSDDNRGGPSCHRHGKSQVRLQKPCHESRGHNHHILTILGGVRVGRRGKSAFRRPPHLPLYGPGEPGSS